MQLTNLPDLSVWDRVMNSDEFVCDYLTLRVHAKKFLFGRDTPWINCYCVLSGKSHFIIYVKQKQLTGYVVKMARAKKIKVSTYKLDTLIDDKDSLLNKKVSYIILNWEWTGRGGGYLKKFLIFFKLKR